MNFQRLKKITQKKHMNFNMNKKRLNGSNGPQKFKTKR